MPNVIRIIDVSAIDTMPRDLCVVGNRIWIAGEQKGRIYQLDMNGKLISSFAPAVYPYGVASDGKFLYTVSHIFTYFAAIQRFNFKGNFINEIAINPTAWQPECITFDGKYIYYAGPLSETIYKIDPTFKTVSSFSTAGFDANPVGLTFDGKYLYMVGTQHDSIYQLDLLGNVIRTIDIDALDDTPTGIAFDGKYFYQAGKAGSVIYQLSL